MTYKSWAVSPLWALLWILWTIPYLHPLWFFIYFKSKVFDFLPQEMTDLTSTCLFNSFLIPTEDYGNCLLLSCIIPLHHLGSAYQTTSSHSIRWTSAEWKRLAYRQSKRYHTDIKQSPCGKQKLFSPSLLHPGQPANILTTSQNFKASGVSQQCQYIIDEMLGHGQWLCYWV